MAKNKVIVASLIVASTLALGQLSVLSAATAEPGSKDDPVVTVSYMNQAMSNLKKEILSTTGTGSTTTPSTTTIGKGTITASSLNIRSGAGTSYGIVGTIPKGTTITLLSKSNDWYKIQYNNVTGWVNSAYVLKI